MRRHVDHQASKLVFGTDKKVIADLESKVSCPAREVHRQVVVVISAFREVQEPVIILN